MRYSCFSYNNQILKHNIKSLDSKLKHKSLQAFALQHFLTELLFFGMLSKASPAKKEAIKSTSTNHQIPEQSAVWEFWFSDVKLCHTLRPCSVKHRDVGVGHHCCLRCMLITQSNSGHPIIKLWHHCFPNTLFHMYTQIN